MANMFGTGRDVCSKLCTRDVYGTGIEYRRIVGYSYFKGRLIFFSTPL